MKRSFRSIRGRFSQQSQQQQQQQQDDEAEKQQQEQQQQYNRDSVAMVDIYIDELEGQRSDQKRHSFGFLGPFRKSSDLGQMEDIDLYEEIDDKPKSETNSENSNPIQETKKVRVSENMAPVNDQETSLRRRTSLLKKLSTFLVLVVIALAATLMITGHRLRSLDLKLQKEGQWSPYTPCSVSCGGGEQIRFRNCHNNHTINNSSNNNVSFDANFGVQKCAVANIQPCNLQPCPKVWLVGGKNNSEGNVFAFNPDNYKSGPVCHDNWNIAAGHVVCRQLGFRQAVNVTKDSTFGRVPMDFSFDDVECSGNETQLSDCRHSNQDNCFAHEVAGVICE